MFRLGKAIVLGETLSAIRQDTLGRPEVCRTGSKVARKSPESGAEELPEPRPHFRRDRLILQGSSRLNRLLVRAQEGDAVRALPQVRLERQSGLGFQLPGHIVQNQGSNLLAGDMWLPRVGVLR